MGNENPLNNVSDKMRKTWEAYGTMNCWSKLPIDHKIKIL
jgi:hypothetical protein